MSAFKSDRDPGFDLGKYESKRVRVKFQGGREVDGTLKGFDKLDNLVLDNCVEYLRGTCRHNQKRCNNFAFIWKPNFYFSPIKSSLFLITSLCIHNMNSMQ